MYESAASFRTGLRAQGLAFRGLGFIDRLVFFPPAFGFLPVTPPDPRPFGTRPNPKGPST